MKIAKEITVWKNGNVKNHTYILNDSMTKMHGYIPVGQTEKVMFSKEQSFDKKYRQFEILKVETPKKTKVVIGSKGNKYYITDSGCSCPGFTYRGKCKHMETT
jgi:hypothetical protein